jgi:predicted N-acyltransferase
LFLTHENPLYILKRKDILQKLEEQSKKYNNKVGKNHHKQFLPTLQKECRRQLKRSSSL